MKFGAHVIGGSIAGLGIVSAAQITGYTSVNWNSFIGWLQNPLSAGGDISILAGLFFITLFMSLFPDLDTASVLQRWFYRFVFLGLAGVFLMGELGLFAAIAFIALLPLLHRHRGWTHSRLTPFLLVIFFAVIQELYNSNRSLLGAFSFSRAGGLIGEYWIYAVAFIVGHYTHLLLDRRL